MNNHRSSSYSPYILIYLEIGGKTIRLADVLCDTATLYETAEFPANTCATLVYSIDGIEDREEILLSEGITKENEVISFQYIESSNRIP